MSLFISLALFLPAFPFFSYQEPYGSLQNIYFYYFLLPHKKKKYFLDCIMVISLNHPKQICKPLFYVKK